MGNIAAVICLVIGGALNLPPVYRKYPDKDWLLWIVSVVFVVIGGVLMQG